jgi:hypothetical protein
MEQSSRAQFNDDKDKDGAEEEVIGRKSTAQMSLAWLRRNVDQVCLVDRGPRN